MSNPALEVLKKLGMQDGVDAVDFIASRFGNYLHTRHQYNIASEAADSDNARKLYNLANIIDSYELSDTGKAYLNAPDMDNSQVAVNLLKGSEILEAVKELNGEELPALSSNLVRAARIGAKVEPSARGVSSVSPAATTPAPAAPPTPAAPAPTASAAATTSAPAPAPAAATPSPATPAPAQKSGFFSGFGIGAGRTGAQLAQQTDEYTNRVLKGIGLGAKDADAALVTEAKAYMGSADAKFVDDSTLSPQQKAVLSQTRDSFYKSGTMYSDDAIGAMGSNFASTGNVFGGLSAATETTSGNALLRSVQEGGVMGVALMGGALGAAGGMLTGGDASEGAMIGAALGAGVGGVSRAITKSAPEIEAAMMERLLGKEAMEGFKKAEDGTNVPANEVRKKALDAINKMSDEEVGKISGGRAMQKRLTSNKEDSLLTQTRTLTMAGAFLGGVAFTSKKNDHRRGFNKNRGNRI